MKEKIILTSDEKVFNDFINDGLPYLGSFNKNGITIHQFENDGVLNFSEIDVGKIKFTNKLCF